MRKTIYAGAGAAVLTLGGAEYFSAGTTEYDLADWRNASATSCTTPASERYFTLANIAPAVPSREKVEAVARIARRYPNTRIYVGSTPLQRIVNMLVRSEPTAHYVPFFGENRIYINGTAQSGDGKPLLTENVLNRVVAELAHAEEARRAGQLPYMLRAAREITMNALSLRPYNDLRTRPGSFEYEAHNDRTGIERRLHEEIERTAGTDV